MQGISAWLTGGSICLLYISIVLYLAVGVMVCKASVLNWLGVYVQEWVQQYAKYLCLIDWGFHLPSIYMHCTRSSSECSSIQGIFAQLLGDSSAFYIYMYCTISSHRCSSMQGICAWLTGGLDLAVGVVVCKASLLAWLGGPSVFYI